MLVIPRLIRLSLCIMLVLHALALAAQADDITQIGVIDADPETFHLRDVTLHGRVHDVQPLDPYFQPSGTACTGAYVFMLEDESGFLQVAVLGICGLPIIRSPDVTEGDIITLKAVVHAPGRFGSFFGLDGIRRPGSSASPLHAVAKHIQKESEEAAAN